jgi:hypothetical protein
MTAKRNGPASAQIDSTLGQARADVETAARPLVQDAIAGGVGALPPPTQVKEITLPVTADADVNRMLKVFRMVQDHAHIRNTTSGEMRCPECETGTLCYLVSSGDRSMVECSTPGCLGWDIAIG